MKGEENCVLVTLQGPDGHGKYEEFGFAMLHRGFYITTEDALEAQPVRTLKGNALTWDGRLDNRDELLAALGRSPSELPTDVEIASAALSAWDIAALARLVGDWALAWWNPHKRRLVLARDYIGIRKLYYLGATQSFYWSTDLAALVLHSGQRYTLCDPYFAGYFTNFPEPQLTPYAEVQQVPPGGYLEVTPEKLHVHRYWSFHHLPNIRYKTDAEYEEHFRQLFRQSVKRRVRTAYPILADLSGGLDSSSIVCMAYYILRGGGAHTEINTLSYFSTDEPSGDERLYFKAIEHHVGKSGVHLESRAEGDMRLRAPRAPYFAPLPGYFDTMLEGEGRLLSQIGVQGNRLHFSGLGGDELLGGVQNPVPDLARLLWQLRLPSFCRQLETWALQRKTTLWSLLDRSFVALAPVWLRCHLDREKTVQLVGWLRPEFVRQQHIRRRRLQIVRTSRDWLPGPPGRDSGYLSLAASVAGYLPRFTYAEQPVLPFYDRDLVQFLFTIPGEQLLRPHQRRSLMRRALKDIVPDVVLSRKTKALGRRTPALALIENMAALDTVLPETPVAARYADPLKVKDDFENLRHGKEVPVLILERLIGTCLFFHHLAEARLWEPSELARNAGNEWQEKCRRDRNVAGKASIAESVAHRSPAGSNPPAAI